MKTSIKLLTLILWLTQTLTAQSDNKPKQIHKIVNEITDNLSKCTTETKKLADGSDRSIYRKDNTVKFMKLTLLEDKITKVTNYYFSNGYLIYAQNIWVDSKSKPCKAEKFYLEEGSLFQWILDNKEIDKNSKEFKEMAIQYADVSKSWAKDSK